MGKWSACLFYAFLPPVLNVLWRREQTNDSDFLGLLVVAMCCLFESFDDSNKLQLAPMKYTSLKPEHQA